MIETAYSREFNALCEQYSALGYVVLDEGLLEDIKVLNGRYQL